MPASSSSLIQPALAHLAAVAEANSLSESALLAALAEVPDPRGRGGRHSITTVLAMAVCAVLAGARSFTAISEWAVRPGARGTANARRAEQVVHSPYPTAT